MGSAEGVGEEVVFVEGEGSVGGAELDEGGGGGFDGAADLCVEDGGELGDVDVWALAGGVEAVVGGLELDAVGAVGGDGGPPSPSPPRASPPLPLRHGKHATAAVPGRWQSATAAAKSTASITATAAATGFAAFLAEMCLSTRLQHRKGNSHVAPSGAPTDAFLAEALHRRLAQLYV